MSKWTVHHAEVLDALASMESNSFDGMLSDPPYGLGSHQPTVDELIAYLTGADLDMGGDFMGRDWNVPSVRVWRELYRVLKPGASVLAFGGSRTVDLISIGMRAAGFECRDLLLFLHAQGFPKDQNASRAIDEASGEERPIVGVRTDGCGNTESSMHKADGFARSRESTYAVTSAASAAWEGGGTALKPSFEPIILARKPLDGTLAENLARWGVGALAIDACRIPYESEDDRAAAAAAAQRLCRPTDGVGVGEYGHHGTNAPASLGPYLDKQHLGRWPANVLFDEEAAALLDAQSGDRPGMSGGGVHRSGYAGGMFGAIDAPHLARADSGGASRFFFCAKPTRYERELGCDALPMVSAADMVDREEDSDGMSSPRAGAGRTSGSRNPHPTLKAIALTRYLATLLLPAERRQLAMLLGIEAGPRRIVIPYAGSGSEMVGAVLAGWDEVVGIEREPRTPDCHDYIAVLKARVGLAATNPRAFEPGAERAKKLDPRQIDLFSRKVPA